MRKLGKVLLFLCLVATLFSFVHLPKGKVYAHEQRAKIQLSFGTLTSEYYDEILPSPDFTVEADFHNRKINATLSEKIECVQKNLQSGSTPKSAMLYSFPLLEKKVLPIIKQINCTPVDATISFKPYRAPMFTLTREKVGYEVDEQRLYYEIFLALRKNSDVKVSVPAKTLLPAVTVDMLKECTNLCATFSTSIATSTANRKHNIALALSKINGTRIENGEQFSFNKTVGKRTESNGFATAKIILDGQYVDGTGGGVCQASTTVYNCALISGMKITEVHAHSLAPSYVPASFDAMVNSAGCDLRFENTTGLPLFVRAYTTFDRAVVEFYCKKPREKIVRESKLVSKSDVPPDKIVEDALNEYDTATLADGQSRRVRYGAPSVTSEGYLCYYDNGKMVDKKLIRKDVYRAISGIIAVKKKTE